MCSDDDACSESQGLRIALSAADNGAKQKVAHTQMDNLKLTPCELEAFARLGFLEPVPIFTRAECALVLHHFRHGNPPAPSKWLKGHAVSDRLIFDLATRPPLLARLRLLLGNDILLWGASLLTREPKQVHPWHSDIESCAPGGGFASVWIGIDNTSRESGLQLITGSHSIGKTIQQVAQERGLRRGEASAATVLGWAREIIPSAELVQPSVNDGDALFFDGRLWHGSENKRAEGTRTALLFQYAAAGTPVKMPDFSHLEWPFRFKRSRVPVLLVSGSDASGVNSIVHPPQTKPALTSQFHPLTLPLQEDPVARWRPCHLFAGATPNVPQMNVHASVLSAGHSPHPPHAHADEEILIVLDGEAELVIAQNQNGLDARRERVRAGSFVYYPAFQFHTIRNPTDIPITYLMFKWTGAPQGTEAPLQTTLVRVEDIARTADLPFATRRLFEGPSQYLTKLHAHVTELQPGAGYDRHVDAHDVAIVSLSGGIETMGSRLDRHGVIYYPAGEMHDMKNQSRGETKARYLVFEFHGSPGAGGSLSSGGRPRGRWKALLRPIHRRLKRLKRRLAAA